MDLQRIEALLQLLSEHDVSEFTYRDEEISLKLRLGPAPVPMAAQVAAPAALPAAPVAAAPALAPAEDPPPAAPAPAEKLTAVESPMVGTFYRAASPDAEPFVNLGDRVTKGQTLCIVEAMKLMNEIESEVAGTVAEICVENAEPVQFGQALFRIRPD